MRTIWKYKLETVDLQKLQIPFGHEMLTVQIQNGEPQLWVLVNPDVTKNDVFIEVFGTGNPIFNDGPRKYIGTYQLRGGALVFHVFEYLGL